MALGGNNISYDQKNAFKVEIDGFKAITFSKVSGLRGKIGKVQHRGGGEALANKAPGLLEFEDITLERGVTTDVDFYAWFTATVNVAAALAGKRVGLDNPDYKRNADIVQLGLTGEPIKRWTIFGAWPTEFEAGDWDGGSEDVVIEKLVLAIDGFDRTL